MPDIDLLGATYPDVPAVDLPVSGGGTARFTDVTDTTAEAGDVVSGEVFYTSAGLRSTGTAVIPPEMSILSYGTSTWADFIAAYNTNSVVYCRASSNSNPASGAKTRMAFMAYVNKEVDPTNVEFQYYRSVNAHSATQQGDQVYVYKLDKTSGWSVTVRESYSKVIAGTGMSSTYANSAITLNSTVNGVPSVSASDNGKVLKVVNGSWAAASEGGGGSWQDVSAEFVAHDSGWGDLYDFTVVANGSMVWMCAQDGGDMVLDVPSEYAPLGDYAVASRADLDPDNQMVPYYDNGTFYTSDTGIPFSIMWPY